ncbi:hypothetical protein KDA_28300 [Dictyobacter alpinus]|uniref:BD-FAE-like domain-containing protein n=1 Tax=Dictyobacter alpinus TaxID=2014873 RepID=A0A402B7L8_9CHLR|nr:alpha/beta hydrolase [Dictyobacter alpinus]GCE27346.1 hypothetical protein KDA_28300 [Dictyobacter alpinus]
MSLTQKELFAIWPITAGAITDLPHPDIPTLQVYLPAAEQATGAACIVCPGGGYRILADYEGEPVAEWLTDHGVTAFVLRYRLGTTYTYPAQLQDGQRAIRLVRANAQQWQLDPERIAMLGFSAGGHLASMTATHPSSMGESQIDTLSQFSARPNAQILIYPVISLRLSYSPVSSLLNHDPRPSYALLDELDSAQHVSAGTPPAFIMHSIDDRVIGVEHSDSYVAALERAHIPVTYIRGNFGNHGGGLQDFWAYPCIDWLGTLNFARK